MVSAGSRAAKPFVSAALALCVVLAFVLPFLSYEYLAGPATPFDPVQAGAIHWGIIALFGFLWLGVQFFWQASVESTKLSMALSATIFWISFLLFYHFNPPGGNYDVAGYEGAAAFFLLVGGLGIVLLWIRFLADEVHF